MLASYQPARYGLMLEQREMDVLVEVVRMFVRDYHCDERHTDLLADLEEVYANRGAAGGRAIEWPPMLAVEPGDENVVDVLEQEDDEDGGGAVVTS